MMASSPALSSPLMSYHQKKSGHIQNDAKIIPRKKCKSVNKGYHVYPSGPPFTDPPTSEVIFGPMFSGKTTELMRRLKRYQIANYSCLIVKYAKDTRYDEMGIATHDRQTLPAVAATALSDLEAKAINYDIIGIDEGQFFPDVVTFCDSMAEKGKTVIVAALDGTFQRKGFGDILNLVPLAENVIKLSAVCMTCNSDGHFTKRTTKDKSVEVIGGADMYQAVCRDCFRSPVKRSPRPSPYKQSPSKKSVKSPLKHSGETPTVLTERSISQLENCANRQLFISPQKS